MPPQITYVIIYFGWITYMSITSRCAHTRANIDGDYVNESQ
jgi:hypothetical protein